MLYDGQADEKLGSAETVLPKFAFVVSCGKKICKLDVKAKRTFSKKLKFQSKSKAQRLLLVHDCILIVMEFKEHLLKMCFLNFQPV